MSRFYLEHLTRCPCGKPAEVEVMRSGKVSYGKFCKRCGARREKELERVYEEKQL